MTNTLNLEILSYLLILIFLLHVVFKILTSKGKIVVNFTNENLSKFRPLISVPRTLNLKFAIRSS